MSWQTALSHSRPIWNLQILVEPNGKEKEDYDEVFKQELNDVVNPGNTLYVTGLSTRVTERDLEDHFSKEGKIASCFLVVEPRTRASRGFAFISMDTPDDAERCIKRLHQSVLDGRCITVERAIAETVAGIAEVAMTMSIAGLLLGAHRIEVVAVITLLLLDVLRHMEVEGQEGSDRGRFLILRMVVQKGAMVAVLGKAAAYQISRGSLPHRQAPVLAKGDILTITHVPFSALVHDFPGFEKAFPQGGRLSHQKAKL
ncbi:hypothetical protein RHSIM_Rhsim08G0030000 [Rhododendron simsii]|uniref:RRM domain-containing protein n=1 Tax=Rhododendron simsii TaxID=118357 RepID=A0A834GLQ0_RHOSS|nr:hypothetical protein RHSIM_Rhsim08G0030000 [Rhododendron simsii]